MPFMHQIYNSTVIVPRRRPRRPAHVCVRACVRVPGTGVLLTIMTMTRCSLG